MPDTATARWLWGRICGRSGVRFGDEVGVGAGYVGGECEAGEE